MKYHLKGEFIMGSIIESLMRDTKVEALLTNGMNINKYEELLGFSKYIQVEVLLFITFLGAYIGYEENYDKKSMYNHSYPNERTKGSS